MLGKISSPSSFLNRIISKAPETPALGSWYKEALALYDKETIPEPLR